MHKTAATPLAGIYAVLIVYASLYPFTDWRDQGIGLWSFLVAPWPRYWSVFDAWINIIGYLPFGTVLTLSLLRSGRAAWVVTRAFAMACALSLGMETLQGFLPVRVSSREDWLLNSAGALLGGWTAVALEKLGVMGHWSRFRSQWFYGQSRGALVLLAIWPVALLFPPPTPFGVGQVFEKLHAELAWHLVGTPFEAWLPMPDGVLQALSPGAELLCIVLGLLIPCLLGFTAIRAGPRRLLFGPVVIAAGVGASCLSAAMSWGPEHVWAWMDPPCQVALAVALVLALPLALVPARASAALILLSLGLYLGLLNQAPESPYFAQTLQSWEQGQFIRFNGLAQWVGWLWPYAALLYVIRLLWRDSPEH